MKAILLLFVTCIICCGQLPPKRMPLYIKKPVTSVAWTPNTDATLAEWWHTGYGLSTNDDGGLLDSWTGINGNVATNTTTTRPTLKLNRISSLPGILYTSSKILRTPSMAPLTGSNIIVALVYSNATSTSQDYLQHDLTTDLDIYEPGNNTVTWKPYTSTTYPCIGMPNGRWNVFIATRNLTVLTTWINGNQNSYVTGVSGIPASSGVLALYTAATSSLGTAGDLVEVAIFNGYSAETLANVKSYYNTKYNLNNTTNKYIVFDGNSITLGLGVVAKDQYPSVALKLLGPNSYAGINLGISGWKGSQMVTNSPSVVDPLYLSGRSAYVAFEGVNDIAGGSTGEAAANNISNVCLHMKNVGYKVIVGTTMPWGTNQVYDNERSNMNFIVTANYAAFANVLVSLHTNPILFTNWDSADPAVRLSEVTNTVYFQDKTHPTASGYTNIANMFTNAIQSLVW